MESKVAIFFTKDELCTLQGAFEVLVDGSGMYQMLRLPEIVKTHKKLLKEFTEALESDFMKGSR